MDFSLSDVQNGYLVRPTGWQLKMENSFYTLRVSPITIGLPMNTWQITYCRVDEVDHSGVHHFILQILQTTTVRSERNRPGLALRNRLQRLQPAWGSQGASIFSPRGAHHWNNQEEKGDRSQRDWSSPFSWGLGESEVDFRRLIFLEKISGISRVTIWLFSIKTVCHGKSSGPIFFSSGQPSISMVICYIAMENPPIFYR